MRASRLLRQWTVGDAAGAVADLGIFVPLAAALVLVNGLEAGPVLVAAGLLVVVSGLVFRIPFPVQPLKALTALAVAQSLEPEVIHAAGFLIGGLLVLLSVTGLADRLSLIFTKPVIRSLQFAVGVLLVVSAYKLVRTPPSIFTDEPDFGVSLLLALVTVVVVAVAAHRQWYAVALALLVAGIVASWVSSPPDLGVVQVALPGLSLPDASVFGSAFVLLVIPQLPLTYGNAVVGVSDLAHETFGARAGRVTPGRVSLSCGIGNVASALLGGMPMCHGSSGLSAHVRLGARSAAMNVGLGSAFLLLGLVFADQVLSLFSVLPVWTLAGFLAYAGVRHAQLVLDLRGWRLAIALAAGIVGVATGNLAYTTAVALVAEHGRRLRRVRV